MPHVTVIFNPAAISQSRIDELKEKLPEIVSEALSFPSRRTLRSKLANIKVSPDEVLVCQHATHPTDVNVSPVEILIEAGAPKDRDPELVARMISKQLRKTNYLPANPVNGAGCCIWLKFSPVNAFRFINDPTD